MKFLIKKADARNFHTDLVAVGLYERGSDEKSSERKHALIQHIDGGVDLDTALHGEISKQIAAEPFTGERRSTRLLFTAGRIPARFLLLVGLGQRKSCDASVLREAGAAIVKAAKTIKAHEAALVLERGSIEQQTAGERAQALAEGMLLGAYRFDRYKTNDDSERAALKTITFLYHGEASKIRSSLDGAVLRASAQNDARDLVNTPGLDATPRKLAAHARKMAARHGLRCSILNPDRIKRERMGGLLAVAKGSAEPPAFIVLSYKPKGKAQGHVALVGKGVTFDAGGISLKPPRGMELMKGDMAGAATVFGAMQAIAQVQPNVEVTGLIPAAENLPDGKALKPGDIITMRNGKTVEIISTDAEGRLLLADALSYALTFKPDAIVDLATLTGGAAYCCGELYSIVMGNDQRVIDRLCKSAELEGEPMWQLPLVEDYKKGYTSGIADLNNSGKSKAQTILGGIFLREFVDATPWAHLDIAASSWTDEELPICPKGATGSGVRTLVNFVESFRRSG